MTYADFKDLSSRTVSSKALREKALNIAKNQKHDGYQSGLALMVYKLFDKKSATHVLINLVLILRVVLLKVKL